MTFPDLSRQVKLRLWTMIQHPNTNTNTSFPTDKYEKCCSCTNRDVYIDILLLSKWSKITVSNRLNQIPQLLQLLYRSSTSLCYVHHSAYGNTPQTKNTFSWRFLTNSKFLTFAVFTRWVATLKRLDWSHSESPSGELTVRRVTAGVSQFTLCLQPVDTVAVTVADFGADIPTVTARLRHTSTFAFCTWNAGVTHAPQGHCSPSDTSHMTGLNVWTKMTVSVCLWKFQSGLHLLVGNSPPNQI